MRFAGAKLWKKRCNRVANMPLIRKYDVRYDVPTFMHNTNTEAGDVGVLARDAAQAALTQSACT